MVPRAGPRFQEKEEEEKEDKEPPPPGNGGSTDKYNWTQTLSTLEVFVPVPPGALPAASCEKLPPLSCSFSTKMEPKSRFTFFVFTSDRVGEVFPNVFGVGKFLNLRDHCAVGI